MREVQNPETWSAELRGTVASGEGYAPSIVLPPIGVSTPKDLTTLECGEPPPYASPAARQLQKQESDISPTLAAGVVGCVLFAWSAFRKSCR
jgi:hypothetical protein